MDTQETDWNPPTAHGGTNRKSVTRTIIEGMTVGQTLQIEHRDVACKWPGRCGVVIMTSNLRGEGRKYSTYHTERGVMVVRRDK